MHTMTLITVEVENDLSGEEALFKKYQKDLDACEAECESEPMSRGRRESIRKRINCMRTGTRDPFSFAVRNATQKKMEPYDEMTKDPRYLTFVNRTEEITKAYETGTETCIKEPGGRIRSSGEFPSLFIRKGKVCEQRRRFPAPPVRTRKARKYSVVKNYPVSKLFSSLEAFAESRYYVRYDEEHQAYGSYRNPNGIYEDYAIGGAWPCELLVKADCREYSIGERNLIDDRLRECPAGYVWAAAARKKDIAWDALFEERKQRAAKQFRRYEEMFRAKQLEPDCSGTLAENGISDGVFGMLYVAGETQVAYFARHGLSGDLKYHAAAAAFLDLQGHCRYHAHEPDTEWSKTLDEYLDSIPDDTVIVVLDCHD